MTHAETLPVAAPSLTAVLFGLSGCLVDFGARARLNTVARPEYAVLFLLATLGMLMMVSSNDLIALYIGLETQSLALYVMAAFSRDSAR